MSLRARAKVVAPSRAKANHLQLLLYHLSHHPFLRRCLLLDPLSVFCRRRFLLKNHLLFQLYYHQKSHQHHHLFHLSHLIFIQSRKAHLPVNQNPPNEEREENRKASAPKRVPARIRTFLETKGSQSHQASRAVVEYSTI